VQRVESRNRTESAAESHRIDTKRKSRSWNEDIPTLPLGQPRLFCWPGCHIDDASGLRTRQSRVGTWHFGLETRSPEFQAFSSASVRLLRSEFVAKLSRFGHFFWPIGLANFLHTRSSWKLLPLARKLGGKHNINAWLFWHFPFRVM